MLDDIYKNVGNAFKYYLKQREMTHKFIRHSSS